jgi:cholest-4-en-3-one 26-monooxygenase
MDVRLLDRDLYAGDPHPAFTWLRANSPVYHDPVSGIWGLVLHEDIVWAERQPHLFSNAHGSRPRTNVQESMIDSDDPEHADQRRLVARGFTPKQMARYEEHVRAVVDHLLDAALPQGTFDVVTELSRPLPMTLIGEMLGAPESDYELLQHWSDQMIGGADGPENVTDDVVMAAFAWGGWITDVVAKRRSEPGDDLISTLVHAEVGGEPLSDERIMDNALLLLVGGNETTRNVITGGLHALLTHRDQWEALVADPSLVPGAVEECLRWVTPLVNMNRHTTTEVELRGVTIPADVDVLMCYVSANRDEAVFTDPFRFDIRRDPNPHIAFGSAPTSAWAPAWPAWRSG